MNASGTLATGSTVSFAKRDCECALSCPRTSQRICFDELDKSAFPWGRGALGKAITPLRSVAVDSSVIPLGTPLYIAEFDGVPRYPAEEIAAALALPADVPIISLDARDREQAKGALVKITEYALMRLRESLTVNAN